MNRLKGATKFSATHIYKLTFFVLLIKHILKNMHAHLYGSE